MLLQEKDLWWGHCVSNLHSAKDRSTKIMYLRIIHWPLYPEVQKRDAPSLPQSRWDAISAILNADEVPL